MDIPKNRAENLSWWGRVTRETHFNYKSYPCSAVYAYAILNDLLDEPIDEWDLPENIRPVVENLVPNENLQGWRRAEGLSRTQQAFLNEAGVFDGIFNTENNDYTYNRELMSAISVD